jgi:diacylglycerol kinase family enzyme
VDGQRINQPGPGFVVVANCRQYGWRLNPAGRASMSDGVLDVAYFPANCRRELIGWVVRCRLQWHLCDRRLVYRTGRKVVISSLSPQKYQLDGDPPGVIHELMPEGAGEPEEGRAFLLEIEVRPGVLPVLIPEKAC